MPRPERCEGETSRGIVIPPAPEPRGAGAERAERLARLRAALPAGPDLAAGGSVPVPVAARAMAPEAPPDRLRAARLPAWVPDPFSAPGPVAGFAGENRGFAGEHRGFAEAPRGFAGARDPLRPPPVPKPTPVPAFLAPPGEGGGVEEDPAETRGEDPDRAADGLDRLKGIGPGLLWALGRAGIGGLADLAALEPEALAGRLGPIGRLVPARAWIATARAARGE